MADLTDRERRTLSDPQRLLWRDDVEGICPTPGVCWEYGDTTRCGPCAIKQAEKFGVESNHTLPNLPEVYRLRREARDQADEIARLREEVKRLREPTPAMIAAGQAACEWLKDEEAATVYRAMIAAADDGGR